MMITAAIVDDDSYFSKSLKRLFFLIFYFVTPNTLLPQPARFKFEYLTTIDGLSHNNVRCILQDKQGYLWFGTSYGLNRYDGYRFKVFRNVPGDSTTISYNTVYSLYHDDDGLLWAGGASALCSYNPRTETFRNYTLSIPTTGIIHDIKKDDNGLLWLGTGGGLFSFDSKTHQQIHYTTTDSTPDYVLNIFKDKNTDIFWLATMTGIKKFNKKNGTVKAYHLPVPDAKKKLREISYYITADSKGQLWVSTYDLGLYRFNPLTEKFTRYLHDPSDASSLPNNTSVQMMENTDSKIWIANAAGLTLFNPVHESFINYEWADPKGLQAGVVCLLKDRSGIYWLGSAAGIGKYDPKLQSFITLKPDPPHTIQSALTILEDKGHEFWVGDYAGFGSFDENTAILERYKLELAEYTSVHCSLLDEDGTIWLGSSGCIFHVHKKRNGKNQSKIVSEQIKLPFSTRLAVMALVKDSAGTLWIGTQNGGLFRYSLSSRTFIQYQKNKLGKYALVPGSINCFHLLSKDSLLIGTAGEGLVLMHIQSEKFERIHFEIHEDASDILRDIYEDSKHNIWLAMENAGLWQTDASLAKFKNYAVKDGLQSTYITQVVEDNAGQIWLNTNLGLEVMDPLHKRFTHFSAKDGLSTLQPDYLIKTSSGDLIRVDFAGLHIFQSSSVNRNKEIPPVYINHLQILNKTIPIYNDTVIHVAYNQNYISFEYVALNFTQSFKNRYAYRLKGLDKNWIDAGERRFTSYSNIGAGTYTFEVKACNNDGVWNETPARLTLIISPPWWRTWWFYALCIFVVAVLVYTLFRYRLNQKLKAFELRDTISRDLHDEVGSTLSSIGFLSSMALDDVDSNKVKAQSTLSSINESAHKMLDAMNDIIWNIQPENDTIENVVARMISFASEILEAQKISLQCNIADNVKNLYLSLSIRHDLLLIYKEAINNLAKYSQASEAVVKLEFKQPFVVLTIRDNGKGFDPDKLSTGNGLKNMQSRAKKIGAIYNLCTAIGKGTTITVQVQPT
jgi:ligand-binding sensor domain-containing protein